MNREIKFRAWDGNEIYIDVVALFSSMEIIEAHSMAGTRLKKVKAFLQFTGLKDKNGKEIYECDEMCGEDAYGNKIRGVVKFIDGAFLLISSNHFFTQAGHSNHSHTYFRDMAGQLEICGLVIAELKVTEE